jgi:hypothetical protein
MSFAAVQSNPVILRVGSPIRICENTYPARVIFAVGQELGFAWQRTRCACHR